MLWMLILLVYTPAAISLGILIWVILSIPGDEDIPPPT